MNLTRTHGGADKTRNGIMCIRCEKNIVHRYAAKVCDTCYDEIYANAPADFYWRDYLPKRPPWNKG